MAHRLGRVLIAQEEIAERVRELGKAVARDYAGRDPLLVGVLKGAVIFLADLIRATDIAATVDFIGVSSYGTSSRSSGVVKITSDLSVSIEDRHVLLVEDIIDTGRTINYLRRNLQTRHPRSLKLCALLDKAERREEEVVIDYLGFSIPNHFVVGYGLDFEGLYRNLSYIAVLEPDPAAPGGLAALSPELPVL
ncbi:MAG: hypoxanthine phosphoribosyltransferase [Candidatus Rokubacteria bacterium]|nr:hypoxanthine phosphoribosyltransferase [Candidatus Rokubacteria bacterium]